jgi:tight adherence protein B
MSSLSASGIAAIAVVAVAFSARAAGDELSSRRVRGRFTPVAPASSWYPAIVDRPLDHVLRASRNRAIDRGLPAWLDAAARAARSGASLRHALVDGASIVHGAPIGAYLAAFAAQLERGAPLGAALDELSTREATPARHLVLRALRLASAIGGPSTPVLDSVASTLHERAALAREVRALSTQARASAAVMVAAPVVFAAGAVSADPRVGQFFRSPLGLACVALGLALDGAGAFWMARVVRVVA